MGLIPAWRTKIPHAAQCAKKKKERPIKALGKKNKKVEVEEMQVYLGVRFEDWIRVTLTFSLQPYKRLAILQ